MGGLDERIAVGGILTTTGIGIAVALSLIATAFFLLPTDQRHRARGPLWLLASHVVLSLPKLVWGATGWAIQLMGLCATLLLLLSLGNALLLVLMDGVLVRRFERAPPKIFRDIVSGLIYMAAALLTLHAGGVDAASLLTTSALLTAIIGLSLQDTLGNLFAGLSLQGERPFDVGDWIEYGEGNLRAGRVVEINWRATKVHTLEQVELTIPNGQLARASIFNYSRPTPVARRSVYVVVARDVPPGRVQQLIVEAILGVAGVRESPPPSVLTESFEEHGVRYWARFFIEDYSRRFIVDGAVRDRIWYALARAGISPAVPVRFVHVHETGDEVDQRKREAERERNLAALSQVPLLRGVREQDLVVLAQASQALCYTEGEVVVRQGEPGESLFVCLSGELEVRYTPERGPTQSVARLGAGRVFGELSAMTGEPRTATVRAIMHSELLRLDKTAFQRVLADNPPLMELLSQRLTARREELNSLSPKTDPGTAAAATRESEALLERIRGFLGIR